MSEKAWCTCEKPDFQEHALAGGTVCTVCKKRPRKEAIQRSAIYHYGVAKTAKQEASDIQVMLEASTLLYETLRKANDAGFKTIYEWLTDKKEKVDLPVLLFSDLEKAAHDLKESDSKCLIDLLDYFLKIALSTQGKAEEFAKQAEGMLTEEEKKEDVVITTATSKH